MNTPDWDQAACIGYDTELWFPNTNFGKRDAAWDEPRAICKTCPIAAECLKWAQDTGQHDGMWGGLSEKERAELRRRAKPPVPPIVCGTSRGHDQHKRKGETCDPCRLAYNAHQSERRRINGRTDVA